MPEIALKSVQEIKAKLKDLLHRSCSSYIKEHLDPRPENCIHAAKLGSKVQPCRVCGAKPGEGCKLDSQFEARYDFRELKIMFRELLANREWLLRNDRGIAMLLWVLNQLDPSLEPDPKPLPGGPAPPSIFMALQGNTLTMSPEAVPIIQALMHRLPDLLPKDSDHAATLDTGALGQEPGSPNRVVGAVLPAGGQVREG